MQDASSEHPCVSAPLSHSRRLPRLPLLPGLPAAVHEQAEGEEVDELEPAQDAEAHAEADDAAEGGWRRRSGGKREKQSLKRFSGGFSTFFRVLRPTFKTRDPH